VADRSREVRLCWDGAVLMARIISLWRGTCEIALGGRPVATWTPRTWAAGGDIDLDGHRHTRSRAGARAPIYAQR
jgi:hypothetical protein